MSDSIHNIIQESNIQLDSLGAVNIAQKDTVQSFFSNDTATNFSSQMPLLELADKNLIAYQSGDWFTIIVFLLVLYLVTVRFVSSISITETVSGLLKIQSLDTVSFENKTQIIGYILSPFSIFTYAYYLYFFINPSYLHLELDFIFGVFALGIVFLFIFKSLLEKLISIIFNTLKTFHSYFSDHLYILGVSSFIQSLLLIIYFYSRIDIFLWASLFILITFWVFRLIRGFVIGFLQTEFSKSFIILYLCSLEILPILLALKLLIE
ncbi:MAG: DUF4271 domain-containing protein [Bacteroidales bacterium]|nr:DUF4271 domain-containing protein [Bacteroidales bacterium]